MTAPGELDTYQRLRAAILSFDLLPGAPLSERGLEADLDASRTPIRAALMRLENDGLTRRAGRGWQVSPIDLSEVRAVMELREAVEIGAVTLAVQRAGTQDLDTVRRLVEQHRDQDDEETGLRDGSDFHVALARLSGNPLIADTMSALLTRLARTRRLEVRTPQSRAAARDEHLRILDAVHARHVAQAVELVTTHSRGTRDRLLDHLTEERRRLRGRGMAIIESAAAPPPFQPVD